MIVSDMNKLNIDKPLNEIAVKKPNELVANHKDLNVYSKYHDSEINQNIRILNNAIKMTWVGFAILAFCVLFAFLNNLEAAILSGVIGTLLEFISATIYVLVDKSSKSKYQYFEKLSEDETEHNIFSMVETIENEVDKVKLIEMIVSTWCNRIKK